MDATQSQTQSIKIGPEFFAGAFRDYADRFWAFAREVMQNSMDAEAGLITVTVSRMNGNTQVIVEDDGVGMDRDTLENKFLALGESGKRFVAGKTGGMGKAKELVALCHKQYRIDTREWVVEGSGATYTIQAQPTRLSGCRFTILWAGDVEANLNAAFRTFCAYAQWSGTVMLNNMHLSTNLKKGAPRRALDFGAIYTNRSFEGVAIVRFNGYPMFYRGIQFGGTVIVELAGEGGDVLTANRDGLQHPASQKFQNFLTEIAVDKRSALRNREASYTRYQGPQITVTAKTQQVAALASALATMSVEASPAPAAAPGCAAAISRVLGIQETITEQREVARHTSVKVGTQFILKNASGMKTPTYYQPDSADFSSYGLSLVGMWTKALVELHRLFNLSRSFSVGFILDEDSEAEHQNGGEYGEVYYINPAVVVKVQTGPGVGGRSFKKRFKLTERHRILSIAVHEFVHGLGYSQHDENYAGKLTDVFAVVMANMECFNTVKG